MSNDRSIVLNRRIDIEWLDVAAAQAMDGLSLTESRDRLFLLLDDLVSGGRKPGTSCHTTVGILSRVWGDVPEQLTSLRDRSLALLEDAMPEERRALHWVMLIAGFPFFADLADCAGRLLALQSSFSLSQLLRRIQEGWGERSTLHIATQRMTRNLVQWGALTDTDEKGIFNAATEIPVGEKISELLVEALLLATRRPLSIRDALSHPAFFPFGLTLRTRGLRESQTLRVHRQGLDNDIVELASAS